MATRPHKKITGPNSIQQAEHVDTADAKRVVDGGISIELNTDGTPKVFSDISTATFIGTKKQVLVTNSTGAVVFVATGDASVGVPTAADGIPVLPGSQLVIATVDDEYIRASAAIQALVLND